MTKEDHWLKTKGPAFWAKAAEVGHRRESVHKLFGVASMYDYNGTYEDAMGILMADAASRTDTAPQVPPPPESEPMAEKKTELDAAIKEQIEEQYFQYCAQLPEAPALAWTKFVDANGFLWSITLRAGLPQNMAWHAMRSLREQIDVFDKGADLYEWHPHGTDTWISPKREKSDAPPPPPAAKGNGGPPAQDDGGDAPHGKARLNAVKVDADGRVEFYVEGFRWPFKDGRGPETVAALFEPKLGWRADHFKPGAKYERLEGLTVEWEKPSKYYDVIRVF